MKFGKACLRLYAITESAWLDGATLDAQVAQALKGGATCIQYRDKSADHVQHFDMAKKLKASCDDFGVPLIINNDVDLALKVDAAGVHLGQKDMSIAEARAILGDTKVIGVSARTVEAAVRAERDGADYLGVGAIFGTTTKLDAQRINLEILKDICQAVSIPVVAIGGITEQNIHSLNQSGIVGVAVISSIFAQKDIYTATKKLRHEVDIILENKTDMTGKAPLPNQSHHPLNSVIPITPLTPLTPLKTALTIAGSDCSGGAGIQADIKTMTANGVYAMSAITALTAQNTMGVQGIFEVTPEFVGAQLDAIFEDIRPDAVKIGMVSSVSIIDIIAEKLKQYKVKTVVLDPVMVATSGSKLIRDDAVAALKTKLFPLATLITPNIPEAEVLAGMQITNEAEMETAAKRIAHTHGCAVLCKGGHLTDQASTGAANDFLHHSQVSMWFHGQRIAHDNTHGTGCTLSSAITANLAKGHDLQTAISMAKTYIEGALSAGLNLGHGNGPVHHMHNIDIKNGGQR